MTNDQHVRHDQHDQHDKSYATGVPTGKISAGLAQSLELPAAIALASHSQIQKAGRFVKAANAF